MFNLGRTGSKRLTACIAQGIIVGFVATPLLATASVREDFEIGGGIGVMDLQKPAAVAIVRMQLNTLGTAGGYLGNTVGPKIDVEIGIGSDGFLPTLPHADIQATLIRVRFDSAPKPVDETSTMYGFAGLNINYQREVAVDLSHTVTVSLAGAWVDSRIAITPAIKFLVRGLIDIASFGYVRRLNAEPGRLQSAFGWTPNVDVDVGFEFFERFRIILSERAIMAVGSAGGSAFDNENAAPGKATAFLSRSSATIAADLSKHFTVFAEGSYALFAYNGRHEANLSGGLPVFDEPMHREDEHATKGVWQLLVGFGGRF